MNTKITIQGLDSGAITIGVETEDTSATNTLELYKKTIELAQSKEYGYTVSNNKTKLIETNPKGFVMVYANSVEEYNTKVKALKDAGHMVANEIAEAEAKMIKAKADKECK